MRDLNAQHRQLIPNTQYASIKLLQKMRKIRASLGGREGGRTSICRKKKPKSSRKISYFVASKRAVSHSGTQQKRCTFVRACAGSENKICSVRSVYLPVRLTLPTARPAGWNSREQRRKAEGQYSTTAEIQVEE